MGVQSGEAESRDRPSNIPLRRSRVSCIGGALMVALTNAHQPTMCYVYICRCCGQTRCSTASLMLAFHIGYVDGAKCTPSSVVLIEVSG